MKLGQKDIFNDLIFALEEKPAGRFRYTPATNAPNFLQAQAYSPWNCNYDITCDQVDIPESPCFNSLSGCLDYGYNNNPSVISGDLGACCSVGWDKFNGYIEKCHGLITRGTCDPKSTSEFVTTWYEKQFCEDVCGANSSSSSMDCPPEKTDGLCKMCGGTNSSTSEWQQRQGVYVTDLNCQKGLAIVMHMDSSINNYPGFPPASVDMVHDGKCILADKGIGDLLSTQYRMTSGGGCYGIGCHVATLQEPESPIDCVIELNNSCPYCETVIYVAPWGSAKSEKELVDGKRPGTTPCCYYIACGKVPEGIDTETCFPPDSGGNTGGNKSSSTTGGGGGNASSSSASKQCGFAECGGVEGNAECGMDSDYWNYEIDCDLCKCVRKLDAPCDYVYCGCDPKAGPCVTDASCGSSWYFDCDSCKCMPTNSSSTSTAKSSSSSVAIECGFVECGCDPKVNNCIYADCSLLNEPGYEYVVDCNTCKCVKYGTGGNEGGGTGASSTSSGGTGTSSTSGGINNGDGGVNNASSSSSLYLGLVEPLPYYSQVNTFNGTMPDGTKITADSADSGEMTNGNSYDSSTRILQTFVWNPTYDTNPASLWVMAHFNEPVEFTHVRVGPPPCFVDDNLNLSLRNAGAINGNYVDGGLSCDGSFYLGATVEYSQDQNTWTSIGPVTSSVFLDANKKNVTNELVGNLTVKTARYFRVVSNGAALAISEFAIAFVSTKWITILNPAPNFTSPDNGETFSATVLATINTNDTLNYQWQIKNSGVWDDINAYPGISGENTNKITITPAIPVPGVALPYDYDNKIFRCIVTSTGAMKKTSAEETFEMPPIIYGCTDPTANNYNANAQVDNGTCSY